MSAPGIKEKAEEWLRANRPDLLPVGEAPVHSDAGKVTVKELDELVAYAFAQRNYIEQLSDFVSEENKKLATVKAKIVLYLKELGREDYKSVAGNVSIRPIWRVGMPQTDEDKKRLFEWLREKGIFDKYATVNSQSLNSLFNSEWEIAKDRGDGLGFTLPGVPEPKLFEDVSMRKGKEKA